MFSHLCAEFQRSGKCSQKKPACEKIHLCRDFFLGLSCKSGAKCLLNHRVSGRLTGVVANWSNEQRLEFVRNSHPRVCAAYNTPAGCRLGPECKALHVCNDFLVRRPHSSQCTLVHTLLSEPCKRVLKHFSLDDAPMCDDLRWLIVPLLPTDTSILAHLEVVLSQALEQAQHSPRGPSNSALCTVGAIVNHIAKSGGSLPWSALARDLQVSSSDFAELREWLLSQQLRDQSFTGKHSDWIQCVYFDKSNAATAIAHKLSIPDEVVINGVLKRLR